MEDKTRHKIRSEIETKISHRYDINIQPPDPTTIDIMKNGIKHEIYRKKYL